MILALGEKDILQAVTITEVIEAVEMAIRLYETGDFSMPPRSHLDYEGCTLLLMPCFTRQGFGTKLVTVSPDNSRLGLPVINGLVILNQAETGVPLALLNGPTLTALRTGAVGAASLKYLTPENSHILGVVGAGTQGFYQALCAASARPLADIYVYDHMLEKLPAFIERLSQALPSVHIHAARSIEELLEASEIIVTATTSLDPVLPDRIELLKGKHFTGIGSYKPGMREFPEVLFQLLEFVFIDTQHAIQETGDLATPLARGWIQPDQVKTLGSFLAEGKDFERLRSQTTLFKSVGMALFDLLVSQLVYEKAKQKGLGTPINL